MIGRKKRIVGRLGEALLVKHLSNKGFAHLDSNFLKKQGELDVIMEKKGVIHFFEVKTVSREISVTSGPDVIRETSSLNDSKDRSLDGGFRPEENVTLSKLRKISKMIQIYLSERGFKQKEWQFHVAAVFLDQKSQKAVLRFTRNIPVIG